MSSAQDRLRRSRSQIVLATCFALVLGLLLVVAVILPAEYSLDLSLIHISEPTRPY